MVELIRNKWCDDLEDMLQCPICMVRPNSSIYQCIQGHHICIECKSQLSRCPTCSQRWSSSRNRLAENLCNKLDDIKLSLIEPEGQINRFAVPNVVSVGSQTEGTFPDEAAALPPQKKAVNNHAGFYPCRVRGCLTNLPFGHLMNHIRADHSGQYLELSMGNATVFQHTWPVDYKENLTLEWIFEVRTMGVFFLKLSTDVFGNFTGYILMIHNGFIVKHFNYQLEVSCCQEHACAAYMGEVCSCRTPSAVMKEKSLHVSRPEMSRMTNHEKQLKCTVLIGKKPETSNKAEQSNNQQQKDRNPIYRNNGAHRGRGRGFRGEANGALGSSRPTDNRQSRPQSAPGQPQPQPLFGVRIRSLNRQPINHASSISSLPSLYPNLYD